MKTNKTDDSQQTISGVFASSSADIELKYTLITNTCRVTFCRQFSVHEIALSTAFTVLEF